MARKKTDLKLTEEQKVTYQPILDTLDQFYLKDEFNTEFEEGSPDEFKLLSTMRYDPLLSLDLDVKILANPNTDDSRLFFLFQEHLDRLNFELMYFQFDYQITRAELLSNLKHSISHFDLSLPYRLRITAAINGRIDIQVLNTPPKFNLFDGFEPLQNYQSPIWNVYIDTEPILISPFTSFKTTRRRQYDLARERTLPQDTGITTQEVLLFNTALQITEGSITNIAIRKFDEDSKGEVWFTPSLASGCLCGVVRHALLSKGLIKEKLILLKDITVGDEILLFNGLQGVVRGVITARTT